MIKPYMAFAIQPKVYGCKDRKESKKNLDNLCRQIDACMYVSDMEYPAQLLAIPEGAITGFYDEHSRMDHVEACKKIAIRIPGEETDRLSEVAKKWGVYIVAQAKALEPDIIKDRFFNTAFIIDPNDSYRDHGDL